MGLLDECECRRRLRAEDRIVISWYDALFGGQCDGSDGWLASAMTTTKDPKFLPGPHTQVAYVERVGHVIILSLRPNKRENNASKQKRKQCVRGGKILAPPTRGSVWSWY